MPPAGKLPERRNWPVWRNGFKEGPIGRNLRQPIQPNSNQTRDESWKQHWAFQPHSSARTACRQTFRLAQSPVDFFILSRLENHELVPAPEADRRTWLRRVTFDLTGLPPTMEEMKAFAVRPLGRGL